MRNQLKLRRQIIGVGTVGALGARAPTTEPGCHADVSCAHVHVTREGMSDNGIGPGREIEERTPPPPPKRRNQSILNFFPASSNSDTAVSRSSSGSAVDAGASVFSDLDQGFTSRSTFFSTFLVLSKTFTLYNCR